MSIYPFLYAPVTMIEGIKTNDPICISNGQCIAEKISRRPNYLRKFLPSGCTSESWPIQSHHDILLKFLTKPYSLKKPKISLGCEIMYLKSLILIVFFIYSGSNYGGLAEC